MKKKKIFFKSQNFARKQIVVDLVRTEKMGFILEFIWDKKWEANVKIWEKG